MKLTQDGEVLAENKVLILYILNKLEEPITNDGLLRLVLSVMDMNYFYFQQFLLDLLLEQYGNQITSSIIDGYTKKRKVTLRANTLKVNIGLSLVGVITGEFLVSKGGLGYLIVYGGQVFKLDLVMTSVIILAIVAALMYESIIILEKIIVKTKQ